MQNVIEIDTKIAELLIMDNQKTYAQIRTCTLNLAHNFAKYEYSGS